MYTTREKEREVERKILSEIAVRKSFPKSRQRLIPSGENQNLGNTKFLDRYSRFFNLI